jgi:EmrB/QacA subfamily drug resistance transporter
VASAYFGGGLHFIGILPRDKEEPLLPSAPTPLPIRNDDPRRWATLIIVCFAQLMIVLDVTIVNVALPAIQHDLGFSQANLSWVVNAFLVTFGSLLLLAGRLGDLLGRRRVFLSGLVTFTAASLLCGVASTQAELIGGRLLQGVGAAAQASVILAIIVTEFPGAVERARAMSAYVFVSVAGGSLGLLAGGLLTQALSWHWVFFVNLPIGVVAFALGRAFIRADRGLGLRHGVDWLGSLLVTASLMSAIYAIVAATTHGWTSAHVLGTGALAALLMAAFVALEARIENPIVPPRILRVRGLIDASLVRGFLVTGMYSTFFLGTLYLEHVRDYSALETGAAFLPWTLTVAVLSQGITARLVQRFGPLAVLTTGMATAAAGLLLFATVGPDTAYFPTVFFAAFLPWTLTVAVLSQGITARLVQRFGPLAVLTTGMATAAAGLLLFATVGPDTAYFPTVFFAAFLIGLGIGNAFMPLLTLAMAHVPPADAGLGSGITNVAQQISGALGLAVLSTVAADHTKGLLSEGNGPTSALLGGYHVAFLAGAVAISAGIVLAFTLLRPRPPRQELQRVDRMPTRLATEEQAA